MNLVMQTWDITKHVSCCLNSYWQPRLTRKFSCQVNVQFTTAPYIKMLCFGPKIIEMEGDYLGWCKCRLCHWLVTSLTELPTCFMNGNDEKLCSTRADKQRGHGTGVDSARWFCSSFHPVSEMLRKAIQRFCLAPWYAGLIVHHWAILIKPWVYPAMYRSVDPFTTWTWFPSWGYSSLTYYEFQSVAKF